MFKRAFYLLILFLFLHPSVSFAAPSPGLNLINNPNSHSWVFDSAVKNWMVIIPETPEGLARFNNIPAQNVVIRIHAAWMDVGKKMLDSDSNQTQVANAWCNVINSYPKNNIYIEPFNELEQDYERVNLSGNIDLDTAIERANSFISKLQSCLTKGTIISPALDPQNANFPTTSAAFSRFSIISYHPYREDTAKNYSSGPLSGKTFIFTEVGVDNGGVVYDDCEFIKFFCPCGKGVAGFWQGQGDILAYTLFTFSPGNYAGSWHLTNKKVTDALKNNCGEDYCACTTDPNAIFSLRRAWGYIPPVQIKKSKRGVPNEADPKHPEDKSSKFFSNPLTEDLYKCTYTVNISETFNPKKTGVGVSGAEDTYAEQHINEIDQTLASDRYTNASLRNSSLHLARGQAPDFTASDKELKTQFLSYSYKGDNAVVRYLPEKDKQYTKGTFIEDACLSLDNEHDVVATDEQLAWACPDGPKNLLPKPGNVSSCRPVTICEVGWNYYKRGKNTSFQKPKSGVALKGVPLPGDVIDNMVEQFEGGGYKNIFKKDFSPISDSAYDILYKQMPLIPRGSVNTQIETSETEPGQTEPKITKVDRTLPLAAPLSSRQTTYALHLFNAKKDQETFATENNSLVCTKIIKGDPIVDKPTPISLWARILAFFGIVHKETKTFSGEKQVTLILTKTMVDNLKQDEGFLKNGLPAKVQKETDLDNVAKSSTDGIITRDPGEVDAAARNLLDLQLKPASWQKFDNL